jgi:hypothetical protein
MTKQEKFKNYIYNKFKLSIKIINKMIGNKKIINVHTLVSWSLYKGKNNAS